MFVDEVYIKIISGKGGDGAVSFRREKFVQFGGPDGGHGGKGGDVVFIGSDNINTLIDFKYKKLFKAIGGENGKGKNMNGKQGEDIEIYVPIGTMVRDKESNQLIADIRENGERRIILNGGRGGRGNTFFKSSIKRTPKIAQKGEKGFELEIKLELKLLGDVALVGYPNVGKSSFINLVSAAKSKVANYHFTTLTPKLGVVRIDEGDSFVIADIPGLIEGAHEGKGLGDRFLKHIERCRMVMHIVDISETEGRDPIEDFEKINNELKKYSEKLSNKKQIIVANKMDVLVDKERSNIFREHITNLGLEFFSVSVAMNEGIKPLLYYISQNLKNIEKEPLEDEVDMETIISADQLEKDWILTKDKDGAYNVDGRVVRQTLDKYVFNDEEAIVAFIQIMRTRGLEKFLRKNGVLDGDVVRIFDLEFDFVE